MKKFIQSLSVFSISILLASSCNRTRYSATDNTFGIANVAKSWSGYSTGYFMGDTATSPGAVAQAWAKYYYHVVNDSSFSVVKVNCYQVSVMGIT